MKKYLTMILAVAVACLTLAGCSLQQKVGSAASTLVSNYCTKPEAERALVRVWIDQATTPNTVRVNCAADQVTTTPTTPEVKE